MDRVPLIVTEERLEALVRARRNHPLRLLVTDAMVDQALGVFIVAMQETGTTREGLRQVLCDLAFDYPPADG